MIHYYIQLVEDLFIGDNRLAFPSGFTSIAILLSSFARLG